MTLPKSILRPAAATDLSAIQELLQQSDLPVEDVDAAMLENFLIAASEHDIHGVAGLQVFGFIGLLRSVVVSDTVRGMGLGQQLLAGIEALARDHGVRELLLLTTDAGDYFAANGYQMRDRGSAPEAIRSSAEFTDLCPSDAKLMSRRLY